MTTLILKLTAAPSFGALKWLADAFNNFVEALDEAKKMARDAERALTKAGANVTYREIEDLSHTYPRELNPAILAWLRAA